MNYFSKTSKIIIPQVSVLLFLTILTHYNANASCPGFESSTDLQTSNPQLIFSPFPYHGKIIKTNDYIFINTSSALDVRLSCWASYPIDLKFTGHLTNQQGKVITKVSKFMKSDGTLGFCYAINVSLTTLEEITGNYSCYSISNSGMMNSTYIYAYSPPPGIFLRGGETITIVVKPGQKSVILPCAISNPEIEVQLQKIGSRNRGGGEQWLLETPEGLKFDPKIGYKMFLSDPNDIQLGEYQCRIPSLEINTVTIKLVKHEEWSIHPKVRRVDIRIGEQLRLSCMSSTEVSFEAIPSLSLQPESVDSADDDKVKNSTDIVKGKLGFKFFKTFHSTVFNETKSGVVRCVRSSDRRTLHQWEFQVSDVPRVPGILDVKSIVNACPILDSNNNNTFINTKDRLVLYECGNWVECRLSKCLRNDATCQPNNQCFKKLCMKNGIIQCPTSDGVVSAIYFTGFNGKKYTDWKYAGVNEILKIESEPIIKSHAIQITCEGTNFVFSGGFQWSIKYPNGTMKDLDNSDGIIINEMWGRGRSTVLSTVILSASRATDINKVDSFICSAPVWNTTEWIKQNISTRSISEMWSRETKVRMGDATDSSMPRCSQTLPGIIIIQVILLFFLIH